MGTTMWWWVRRMGDLAGAAYVYYGSAAGLLESSEDLILAGLSYSSYGTSVAGGEI